jgi:hypothetical protein
MPRYHSCDGGARHDDASRDNPLICLCLKRKADECGDNAAPHAISATESAAHCCGSARISNRLFDSVAAGIGDKFCRRAVLHDGDFVNHPCVSSRPTVMALPADRSFLQRIDSFFPQIIFLRVS